MRLLCIWRPQPHPPRDCFSAQVKNLSLLEGQMRRRLGSGHRSLTVTIKSRTAQLLVELNSSAAPEPFSGLFLSPWLIRDRLSAYALNQTYTMNSMCSCCITNELNTLPGSKHHTECRTPCYNVIMHLLCNSHTAMLQQSKHRHTKPEETVGKSTCAIWLQAKIKTTYAETGKLFLCCNTCLWRLRSLTALAAEAFQFTVRKYVHNQNCMCHLQWFNFSSTWRWQWRGEKKSLLGLCSMTIIQRRAK